MGNEMVVIQNCVDMVQLHNHTAVLYEAVMFTPSIILSGHLSAGLVRVYVQQVPLQDEVNGHLINGTDGLIEALLQEHNTQSKSAPLNCF